MASAFSALWARKPVAEMAPDDGTGLKRTLGAGDLIMLAIGAVIGAGIFSTLGTAAVGEVGVRAGAGPALPLSFLLLGAVCALAALCYAELASMIPQAGSAYAYAYATLGELVAWMIGWDLILEYAVGNVAVAIAWSGYVNAMLSGFGAAIPSWLALGYFDVKAGIANTGGARYPEMLAAWNGAPRIGGLPILINLPAFGIVAAITWLLLRGVRESARVNNAMVAVKLLVLTVFCVVGGLHIDPANYTPFAPNGFAGIHQGAAIAFFAYIGFDAISTAAEETKNPQRNLPLGILGGLAICTLIYVIVAVVAVGLVPYTELTGSDPLARALSVAGFESASIIVAAGAAVSMAAVLLVFQYGQPRIFFSMARDGLMPRWAARVNPKTRVPSVTTMLTGLLVAVAALVADDDATYDLTNIGTLFAFAVVCIGVLVLRVREPERVRPFRVPGIWFVSLGGAAACVFIMSGLPPHAWERFGIWLLIGLVIYVLYGRRHSVLRTGRAIVTGPAPAGPEH
ncbi:MAG TPA: amino acid permease [Rubricoccaceae bacterium]|jgi:APA family basic amino acid/polyamine antiporter